MRSQAAMAFAPLQACHHISMFHGMCAPLPCIRTVSPTSIELQSLATHAISFMCEVHSLTWHPSQKPRHVPDIRPSHQMSTRSHSQGLDKQHIANSYKATSLSRDWLQRTLCHHLGSGVALQDVRAGALHFHTRSPCAAGR